MNNSEQIPFYDRVLLRLKSWLVPQTVDPGKVRALILGTLISVVIAELCAYKLLKQAVVAGELNVYTTDFVIVGIALVEVVLGPLVAWYGYRRRRAVLAAWNVALAAASLLWLALPPLPLGDQSPYCNANNSILRLVTATSRGGVRLLLLVSSGAVFCLSRVAAWSHGIAYIAEHAPERINLHFGVLTIVRVVPLIVFEKYMAMSDKSVTLQVLAVAGSTVGNVAQVFLFMPRDPPPADRETLASCLDRGFFASIGRVVRNTLAMSQMAALGLLAAALWGFAYHEVEIVKVKYLIDIENTASSPGHILESLRYLVVIMAVVYVGVKLSPPILPEFTPLSGIKQAALMSVLTLVFYILLMAVGGCNTGPVAGLERSRYTFPDCSLDCGCAPRWNEFSPVCVVDQVTTYLSPCHAGCSGSVVEDNILVFTNCTCAPGEGRAAAGGCGQGGCQRALEVHHVMFITLVMLTVLAFQAQGAVVLRAVGARDAAAALGVAGAVVAATALVCGHLVYVGIRAASCRWLQGGRCHLQDHSFPVYVGSASAVMVFLSIVISVTAWVAVALAERRAKEDLASPEERTLMER